MEDLSVLKAQILEQILLSRSMEYFKVFREEIQRFKLTLNFGNNSNR